MDQSKLDAEHLAHVRAHGGWHKGVYWLTLAEREELSRKAKETGEYAKRAFAHLRPKPEE